MGFKSRRDKWLDQIHAFAVAPGAAIRAASPREGVWLTRATRIREHASAANWSTLHAESCDLAAEALGHLMKLRTMRSETRAARDILDEMPLDAEPNGFFEDRLRWLAGQSGGELSLWVDALRGLAIASFERALESPETRLSLEMRAAARLISRFQSETSNTYELLHAAALGTLSEDLHLRVLCQLASRVIRQATLAGLAVRCREGPFGPGDGRPPRLWAARVALRASEEVRATLRLAALGGTLFVEALPGLHQVARGTTIDDDIEDPPTIHLRS